MNIFKNLNSWRINNNKNKKRREQELRWKRKPPPLSLSILLLFYTDTRREDRWSGKEEKEIKRNDRRTHVEMCCVGTRSEEKNIRKERERVREEENVDKNDNCIVNRMRIWRDISDRRTIIDADEHGHLSEIRTLSRKIQITYSYWKGNKISIFSHTWRIFVGSSVIMAHLWIGGGNGGGLRASIVGSAFTKASGYIVTVCVDLIPSATGSSVTIDTLSPETKCDEKGVLLFPYQKHWLFLNNFFFKTGLKSLNYKISWIFFKEQFLFFQPSLKESISFMYHSGHLVLQIVPTILTATYHRNQKVTKTYRWSCWSWKRQTQTNASERLFFFLFWDSLCSNCLSSVCSSTSFFSMLILYSSYSFSSSFSFRRERICNWNYTKF